ncbi:uncharacterized protein N7477_002083 [Penicillium maclennaniae]|uniref:uncharacterized protein n=1 Tax=Penicillium maclennaniae TaxID=1343394 RepID=UPI002542289E|nr:uncharacterized protein N7477_002083 [Penicillium maclennaniae]KAJ5682143.1 hypothetical protein N7477_002083 [Penicillium maclennaniae]
MLGPTGINFKLSCAAKKGHEATVKLLLAKDGVNPDSKMVKLLLAQDSINPESKDNNGQTPLVLAAANGQKGMVELLLVQDSINPDSKDNKGQTLLLQATTNGHEGVRNVLQLLLMMEGINLESKDANGQTPLSKAAGNGHSEVVKLLLENGSDLNVTNNDSNPHSGEFGCILQGAVYYGYEALQQPDLIQKTLEEFARLLLASIQSQPLVMNDQVERGYRPIVFIALCLGGIMLMEALVAISDK